MSAGRVEFLDVSRAISRLGQVYRKGARRDELAPIWLDVLGQLSREAFDFAVHRWITGEEKFFPTPGQLLALGRQYKSKDPSSQKSGSLRENYRAWCATTYDERCPICGAAWIDNAFEGNRNPKFGEAWQEKLAIISEGELPPLFAGVLHVKKAHDFQKVPIQWKEPDGVLHDGFWR